MAHHQYGEKLRNVVRNSDMTTFTGVYDVFSASIAAKYNDGIFVSGFGFAASFYGLPDVGFIAWPDMVSYVQRMRTILPDHHILVDIDDGYCDTEVACHVVSLLESVGASGVIMEDQLRPRRCGHVDGKQIMELEQFMGKLEKVMATRQDIFVVARTDAADPDDILRRVRAFSNAGVDAILVDGLRDLQLLPTIKKQFEQPLMFNQLAGGKSQPCDLDELKALGVSLVNYSTPCLFAAQTAIEDTMQFLKKNNGRLPDETQQRTRLSECNCVLSDNLARRDKNKTPCKADNCAGDSAPAIQNRRVAI